MTNYFKILCGVIALGIAVYVGIGKRLPPTVFIALYWAAVTLYWFFNLIGG